MKRFLYRFGWLLASNNGRCLLLWLITVFFLIMTILSGFGEPITSRAIDEMIYDVSRESGEIYSQPPPTSSIWWCWKWLILFFIFFIASVIYTPIAFREEVADVFGDAWRKVKERREAEAETKAETKIEETKKPPAGKTSFGRLFSIDLLAEFAWGAISKIFAGLIGGR